MNSTCEYDPSDPFEFSRTLINAVAVVLPYSFTALLWYSCVQCAYTARTGKMGAHMKKQAMRHDREEKAALKMQGAWRGREGRAFARMQRAALAEHQKDLEKAARKLQRIWRGREGRQQYLVIRKNKHLVRTTSRSRL